LERAQTVTFVFNKLVGTKPPRWTSLTCIFAFFTYPVTL
jgi:hypothetical protein